MEVRGVRWLNKHNAAVGAQLNQSWTQQGDFANTRPFEIDFDQIANGPAPPGQLVVELPITGRKRRALRLGQLRGFPEGRMNTLGVIKDRGFKHWAIVKYCINKQYISG